ncbi:MAG: hypothetical protein GY791_17190 [Alphaproteobacteria bacterium]|nr:hypothetical protein [Alphaproteobacteria bacterium]
MKMPDPDQDIIARRQAIVADLNEIVTGAQVITGIVTVEKDARGEVRRSGVVGHANAGIARNMQ